MNKLLLIDAYAFIYRAYYAYIKSPRITSKGQNTSAIYGFVQTLDYVLKEEQPTHIGVAFDRAEPTFRHEIFPEYKAQRAETPEDIHAAVPYIKRILNAYHIPILEAAGYEADDVIGTLALKAGAAGFRTLMMTPDKDYGQLVGGNVFIYKPRFGHSGFDLIAASDITEKYGLESPCQVIDLLGLMGDKSDNIPGCPGVGEVGAKALIKEFGSIENMLQHTEMLKGAMQTKVCNNVELIRLSKHLATIKTDVPIEFKPDELKRQQPDCELLSEIYRELEFSSLIDRMKPHSMASHLSQKKQEEIPVSYKTLSEIDSIKQLVETLGQTSPLSFNIIADSTNPLTAALAGISISVKKGEAYYIPFDFQDDLFNSARTRSQQLLLLLKPLFENENTQKVSHNIKFNLQLLQTYGVSLKGVLSDTMIAHYLLTPEQRHNFEHVCESMLGITPTNVDTLLGAAGKQRRTMRDVPLNAACQYACQKADLTLQLQTLLQHQLKECGMGNLYASIEMPLTPILATMERTGVRLNVAALNETATAFNGRLKEIEENIYHLASTRDFNISSPKQVGELLFDTLQLAYKAKKTKGGQYSTTEEDLEKIRSLHPVVEQILAYRGLKKLLNTYVEALPALINPRTSTLHTTFSQTTVITGRLSSSNPNLQNIPVRNEDGREVRRAFTPLQPSHLFFSADYSQIELRVMAHMSRDEHLIAAFQNGEDIHTATAARTNGVPLNEVSREMRRRAKAANFGIIYGISAFGLAAQLGIPQGEARAFIDSYFQQYPAVRTYMDSVIQHGREQGYVETLFGRRLYLPNLNSANAVVRSAAERVAINAPIQGTAADIMKLAMVRINTRLQEESLKTQMMLQVHDELCFSVPSEEREAAERLVAEEMQRAATLSVPLIADAGWGSNWLEAH